MKPMDFFTMQDADPQPHLLCGKGLQRRRAKKGAVTYKPFDGTDY